MTTKQIILPSEKFRLEEINLPEELATSLAGREITVDVLPEEPPLTRRFDLNDLPDGLPILIDEEGVAWNAYSPPRVLYTDAGGRVWRLPRHWLSDGVSPVVDASRYEVTDELCWHESGPADVVGPVRHKHTGEALAGCMEKFGFKLALRRRNRQGLLERPVRVGVEDSPRLAATAHQAARLRRVAAKQPAQDIAEEFGGRIVAVNYHPGSLCCLSDGYRVRDGRGTLASEGG